MAYTIEWDENSPIGNITPADTLDTELQNLKTSVRERLEDHFPDWDDDLVDPKVLVFPAGAVGTPSIRSATDETTGIWFPDDGELAVSLAGLIKLLLTPGPPAICEIFASLSVLQTLTTSVGVLLLTGSSDGVGEVQIISDGATYSFRNGTIDFGDVTISGTVGPAGGASALPASPSGYLPIDIGGLDYQIPYYLRS